VLRVVHALPGCTFWPDSLSYVDTDLGHVRGHRQVTAGHLVSLAAARADAVLATLDEGLAQSVPQWTSLVSAASGWSPLDLDTVTRPSLRSRRWSR
jgi:hypothetical protein